VGVHKSPELAPRKRATKLDFPLPKELLR
jgi:hypothetical protein